MTDYPQGPAMNRSMSQQINRCRIEKFSHAWPVLFITAMGIVLSGCQQNNSTANRQAGGPPAAFADQITAPEIFASMVNKYRNATRYSDRAVLYMSYRLNGRAIQEPQPWSISIDEKGRFAADLFNAQVRCDGKILSCYVYDIESGNLDDQRLLLPVRAELPIRELYNDKIAQHFIAGYSEMPLDEEQSPDRPQLVPPTIGLLTGLMEPAWLRPDVRLERYEDSEIDGRACFVLRCWQSTAQNDFVDLWIDKDNDTIWQAALPLDCLAAKVQTSPEIENLRLVARFHEASFDQAIEVSRFTLKPHPEATPVSQFVKIPEPLHSELIGMKSPEFELRMQSGKQLSRADFVGRPTALLWIGGDPADVINKLDQVKSAFPADAANFGVVYSDRDLADPEVNGNVMNMQLNEIARNTSVPFYFDKELTASMQLAIKSLPCLVLLDKDSTIQFAIGMDDPAWPTAVKAAIERVNEGDDVGSEMLSEYQQFLEAYHQKLLAVSAADLIDNHRETEQAVGNVNASRRLNANRTWTNSQFKSAGNILAVSTSTEPRLFVLDGWRTVVELDTDGKIISRYELELPEHEAVGVLRAGIDETGQQVFATFMPQGKAVYVFDRNWKLIANYPPVAGGLIRDAQFTTAGTMLVAFDGTAGLHKFDIPTMKGAKISDLSARSISRSGRDVICDGAFVQVSSGKRNAEFAAWQLSRFGNSQGDSSCCIGTSKDGSWYAMGIKEQSVQWSAAIGPQLFDKNIEPVSATAGPTPFWAIAGSNRIVQVFSHGGSWLGDFQSDSEVLGLALINVEGQLRLIVSTNAGVTNWNLDVTEVSARAAANRGR
jgi:hypothetical protein